MHLTYNQMLQSEEGILLADVLQRCGINQTIRVCIAKPRLLEE